MNSCEKVVELELARAALSKTKHLKLKEPMLAVQRDNDGLVHVSIARLAEKDSGIVGITTSIAIDPSKL